VRRPWALPLVPLYWIGLRVRNSSAEKMAKRLRRPVVSVGSLSAGGAGKTPVVLMLAELLQRYGIAVDVLSRGYGRGSSAVEQVDPAGSAARFGDEPMEMARRGVRVFVGADRWAAGRMAEEGKKADPAATPRDDRKKEQAVHLLDDGFQHRKLARDLDVVLLTVADVEDWLLPAGNLREPLSALRRADVVVVREEEAGALAQVIAARSTAQIWVVRRELTLPLARPRRPVVFCGIARPDGFLKMVREAGCVAAREIIFPDHHAYTAHDFTRLVAEAGAAGADGFCTTAKDAVKIPGEASERMERVGPIAVGELRVSLQDEARPVERLRRLW
jgi:tetraacyldisaccharide 4'-kinase